MSTTLSADNLIPFIIYGTAWKQDATSSLVVQAVHAGFRGIDSANQKKHYREDYLGDALLLLRQEGIARDSLFLQSKFTYAQGQDHRLPYDPSETYSKQVYASFASTLKNLHTDYLDCYLLHGPISYPGITDADREVWHTMEQLYRKGAARFIGVSNVNLSQLRELCEQGSVKPMMVQNRCFANQGWDRSVREYCQQNNIFYQGFSLLTANWELLSNGEILSIAESMGGTPQQIIFCLSRQIGILPITGTTDSQHMKDDLASLEMTLSVEQVKRIEGIWER